MWWTFYKAAIIMVLAVCVLTKVLHMTPTWVDRVFSPLRTGASRWRIAKLESARGEEDFADYLLKPPPSPVGKLRPRKGGDVARVTKVELLSLSPQSVLRQREAQIPTKGGPEQGAPARPHWGSFQGQG